MCRGTGTQLINDRLRTSYTGREMRRSGKTYGGGQLRWQPDIPAAAYDFLVAKHAGDVVRHLPHTSLDVSLPSVPAAGSQLRQLRQLRQRSRATRGR
eukprot:SAG25_NODE_569_length_6863_cov_19.082200_5_plen_97_part_00